MNIRVVLLAMALAAPATAGRASEIVLHFDEAQVGKPVTAYTNSGVVFVPAREPKLSRAKARVMFFPHLKTEHKGILNAMANEPIPVEVRFPHGATSATLVFWGSTGCPALVEAYDKDGKVVDKAALASVPDRTSPAEPVPTVELTVKAPEISYIRFSGQRTGEYLAAQELRYTPPAGQTN